MIDQSTVDRILDAANIVEVVSDFVTLRKRGVNYTGLCPFHDEKTPSFSVSPSKGICKCFSCGKGGGPVHFIMEHEQLSYYEALRYLANKYHIEIQERELTEQERLNQNERESMFVLNAFALDYFQTTLTEHAEGRAIGMSYFRERGFRDDIIKKFQLGYSLDEREAFVKVARQKGYKDEYLIKTGLAFEHQGNNGIQMLDRFRGRVIFPVHTISGKVVAFGGRILKKDEKMAKYVNSPESSIYHKSKELYGLYLSKSAIVKNDCCYLVEGYTDVISMHQTGIENVVASSGTALTPGQIRMIHRFTNNITVIYDGDAAGIKASIRGIDLILKEGMNIKVVLLPDGEDPDSFSKSRSATDYIEYIKAHETDFIRFKTKLLMDSAGNDPIKRAELITDIVQSISYIPDTIIRSVYTKECSRLLDVSEEILVREVGRLVLSQETNVPLAPASTPASVNIPSSENQSQKTESSETAVSIDDLRYEIFELALIRYVIRYGNEQIEALDPETNQVVNLSIISYIQQEMGFDELAFGNPLYKQIFNEALELMTHETFNPARYFSAHQDGRISRLATNLLVDKYELSRRFQPNSSEKERLQELLPRAIYELKEGILKQQINDLKKEIKIASKEGNTPRIEELLHEITSLNEIKKALAKALGERIVYRL